MTSLTHEQRGSETGAWDPEACPGDAGKGCGHSLDTVARGAPPARGFRPPHQGTGRGLCPQTYPKTLGQEVGERQRVGHTCEAGWTAGLAWLPRPPPAPVCPAERPGVSHTPRPGLASSVGVGTVGRRLGTRRGRGLGGWG